VAAEYELVGRGSILQKLTMKLARRARKVIVSGDKAIHILRKQGIPDKKIIVYRITSLVDLSAFVPLGKNKSVDLIVVTRLARDKHIDVFVDIVDTIRKVKPDVRADIVGNGIMMEELVDYVESKGLSENIVFHGWLPDPESVNEALNSAKIFVMNSSHEGGPFSVPEAMAAGLCVVSSDVGEVKKVIHHGHDGFVIDRHDDLEAYVSIIQQLLDNPKRLQEIQQKAAAIKEKNGNQILIGFWRDVAANL
jgi:glycosyltransferase involved in cell wall biosynthesis